MPDHDEPDPLRAYPPSFFDPRYPEDPPDDDDDGATWDDEADLRLLTQATDDKRQRIPETDFPEDARHRLAALTEMGMLRLGEAGYAVTYLGALHRLALESAERVAATMAGEAVSR